MTDCDYLNLSVYYELLKKDQASHRQRRAKFEKFKMYAEVMAGNLAAD